MTIVRIARYAHQGKINYGVIKQQNIVSLPNIAGRLGEKLPNFLEDFIGQEFATETADAVLSKASQNDFKACSFALNEVSLLAPIASPPKVLCLGINYKTHIAETNAKTPKEPVIFMKPHTAIVGPNDKIVKRPFVAQLDYEGELAIVIGKTAKDVSAMEAQGYVFGYTVLNDVSARDFQFRGSQWTPGKSFDTFAPTGPCITTQDELGDAVDLGVRTWVNGELRQDGNTSDMVFGVSEIVCFLSRIMTLEPGDIIATGTPSGVAMAMRPPRWLKSGDVVRIEIKGIGTLQNQVIEL